MDSKKECINVSVRIRPVLSQDSTNSTSLQIIHKEPPVLLVLDRSQTFRFDNIFSEDADQEKVFNDAVKPFVSYVKQGYNCTVFAYGQTGTGKTYTMGSGSQRSNDQYHIGIIPRALEQLFGEEQHLNSEEEIELFVSFSEIYNEKVFDLLQPDKKYPLPVSGFVVQGLSMKNVSNIVEAKELLELGNKNRHVGETKQNVNSSRSHAIFTVYFTRKNSFQKVTGKLNLVDLAGSESIRKTGNKGSTLQEGININKGLLSIGQVISALSMKSSYVPYRQSMITSILQGSLNVDNYISLIACVSANPDDTTETLQTLDFAQRAKKVRSNPEVNQVLAKYKKENPGAFGSARTPLKRPSTTPLKTPAMKKMQFPLLPLINESAQSQISKDDNSNISNASSVISANTDITQQTLSPVIRKYITKMQETLMDRLETVIMSTMRRPTRASLLAEKSRGNIEKENTPNVRWSNIQTEVSKMVKNEIAQLTVKPMKTVMATSSPIEDKDKFTARRLLKYDSPDSLEPSVKEPATEATPQDPSVSNFFFKVPERPPEEKKLNPKDKGRSSTISISPIENEMPKLTPRRSIRLSLKKSNCAVDDNTTLSLNASEISFDSNLVSRSPFRNMSYLCVDSKNVQDKSSYDGDCNENFSKLEVSNLNNKSIKFRRVGASKKNRCGRLSCTTNKRKSIGVQVVKTPSKMLVERALKKHKSKDSPYTAHSKKVLTVLNKGTQKDVEKLHTIGSKTAEQILLFRNLKGCFNEIEDLSKVPGWGTKKYEKFVNLNFLRKD